MRTLSVSGETAQAEPFSGEMREGQMMSVQGSLAVVSTGLRVVAWQPNSSADPHASCILAVSGVDRRDRVHVIRPDSYRP